MPPRRKSRSGMGLRRRRATRGSRPTGHGVSARCVQAILTRSTLRWRGNPHAHCLRRGKRLAKLRRALACLEFDNEPLARIDHLGKVALGEAKRLAALADQLAELLGSHG